MNWLDPEITIRNKRLLRWLMHDYGHPVRHRLSYWLRFGWWRLTGT